MSQPSTFSYSLDSLCSLSNPKSIEAFRDLGDLKQLEAGLKTDLKSGLPKDEDHSQRISQYGDNVLPDRPSKSFLQLAWTAFQDKVLIILSVAALVSLTIGLYQTFGIKHAPGEPKVDWVEGCAIMLAVVIVVMVGAVNDWQKEKAFAKLNKKREDRTMAVLRGGEEHQTSIFELLVGDVARFQTGDVLPVDGLLLDGFNVKADESSQTGEIDLMKKATMATTFSNISSATGTLTLKEHGDPVLLSGSKVVDGSGTMLVTAVGIHSTYGSIMMSLRDGDTELTPLQSKLNAMAEQIAKFAIGSALLYFFAVFIKFIVNITKEPGSKQTSTQKGQAFLAIFIESVSIVAVAIPEGLPLAVTLALAIATTRMYKDNNLVRLLRSCETMGNATTICSDKTGTLTQNKMTVVVGSVGGPDDFMFGKQAGRSGSKQVQAHIEEASNDKSSTTITANDVGAEVKDVLAQSIIINSTSSEEGAEGSGNFGGSRTEVALLQFAQESLGVTSIRSTRAEASVKAAIPFNSTNKYMATLVELPSGGYRTFVKGAPDILLKFCSQVVRPEEGLNHQAMTPEKVESIQFLQNEYAERSLRTLCMVYKDYTSWPTWFPKTVGNNEQTPVDHDSSSDLTLNPAGDDATMSDMIFLGMVGIQDPLRPGVNEAVIDCKHAGVVVRMVTGDNIATAKAIALDSGILTGEDFEVIMEGSEFRKMSDVEMNKMLPHLRVLARSTPEDKRILVQHLKALGETVAVTGDGTNDAPALKLADVGFAMGSGTEVAKEASDIILLDDNFASIVKALLWGRTINDAVKKFVQFQLCVNITAVLITLVSGLSQDEPIMPAVQLLWLNLIMDTLAALALATDSPTRSLLERKPERKNSAFISVAMWKMILGQALFQLVVVFILLGCGPKTLFQGWVGDSVYSTMELRWDTLIFNTFVWMQIFNAFNCRRIDNRFNVFEGITRNYYFAFILLVMVGGQILIIFVGGQALQVERLNIYEWIISILPGLLVLPLGAAIRCIPDSWAIACVPAPLRRWLARRRAKKQEKQGAARGAESDEEAQKLKGEQGWDREGLINDLKWLKRYKGGRVDSMKFDVKHPKQSRKMSAPRGRGKPSVTAVLAGGGVVAGSVGGVRA